MIGRERQAEREEHHRGGGEEGGEERHRRDPFAATIRAMRERDVKAGTAAAMRLRGRGRGAYKPRHDGTADDPLAN